MCLENFLCFIKYSFKERIFGNFHLLGRSSLSSKLYLFCNWIKAYVRKVCSNQFLRTIGSKMQNLSMHGSPLSSLQCVKEQVSPRTLLIFKKKCPDRIHSKPPFNASTILFHDVTDSHTIKSKQTYCQTWHISSKIEKSLTVVSSCRNTLKYYNYSSKASVPAVLVPLHCARCFFSKHVNSAYGNNTSS